MRPARVIPLLYFGAAHVALLLACALVAWSPRAVAGFFYHSWMAAVVHLVTLGWITFSILGAMYVVGPVALRMPMPARRGDYIAFGSALVGLVGMVGHFWIQEFGGMAWSAGLAAGSVVYVSVRIVRALRRSTMPPSSRLHIAFACVNIGLAATMGTLMAVDKTLHFLPGYVMSNVFAHAHLAAVGWATMMVVGVAYRLLPMVLPSRMPSGHSIAISAMLLEVGVIGLFAMLLARSAWALMFGVTIAAGLAVFAADVVWMLRSPVPRPVDAPRIDLAVLHAAAAGVWLSVAVVIGLALLALPMTSLTLRLAAMYGCVGLVGFLAQMVVAMEARIVPMFAWYWAFARGEFRTAPTPPMQMREPALQAIVFAGWTLGVPALAAGLFFEAPRLIAAGGWSLLAATAVSALDSAFVLLEITRHRPLHTLTATIEQPQSTQRLA